MPPDTVGDVGPNHYVQMVNTSFAIFDKSGTLLTGPTNINALWSGAGGLCEANNDGDPIVLYDSLADRWFLSQFAVPSPNRALCIAISQTPDPTGAYYLRARLTDSYGNTATSTAQTVVVSSIVAPAIVITAPAHGAALGPSADVSAGVSGVQFAVTSWLFTLEPADSAGAAGISRRRAGSTRDVGRPAERIEFVCPGV